MIEGIEYRKMSVTLFGLDFITCILLSDYILFAVHVHYSVYRPHACDDVVR